MILIDYYGHMVATESEMELHIFARKIGLMWLDDEMESPKDFNERIRKEGGK